MTDDRAARLAEIENFIARSIRSGWPIADRSSKYWRLALTIWRDRTRSACKIARSALADFETMKTANGETARQFFKSEARVSELERGLALEQKAHSDWAMKANDFKVERDAALAARNRLADVLQTERMEHREARAEAERYKQAAEHWMQEARSDEAEADALKENLNKLIVHLKNAHDCGADQFMIRMFAPPAAREEPCPNCGHTAWRRGCANCDVMYEDDSDKPPAPPAEPCADCGAHCEEDCGWDRRHRERKRAKGA